MNITANYTVKWTTGESLPRRVATILKEYKVALGEQLKEEIDLVQFPWPQVTYRKNQTIEGSPRDIVDMGRFRNSQNAKTIDANNIKFTWGGGKVTYAEIIAKGRPDTARYPGRDWITPALRNLPLEQFFAGAWVRNGGSR